MFKLHKITSADCPKCGCNATTLVHAEHRYGKPWAQFSCDFCQHKFGIGSQSAGVSAGVKYRTVRCRCPKCSAANPPVRSTQGRIRHHHCDSCGANFKSVEAVE